MYKRQELDHLCKEEVKCKFYYRYADDIGILSSDKEFLRKVLIYIKLYLATIGLKVKPNYQIFPVDSRGIDVYKRQIVDRDVFKINNGNLKISSFTFQSVENVTDIQLNDCLLYTSRCV